MPTATISPATVRAAQILLTAQGIPLQMDGVLGDQTRRALKEFQRRRQLPRTGELDAATLAALGLPVPGPPERSKDVSNADRERIAAYADAVIDRRHAVIDRSREALNLFALTMATASLEDTEPDLRSAIFKAAVHAAIDALKEALDDQVIGFALTLVIESVEGIQAELERGGECRRRPERGGGRAGRNPGPRRRTRSRSRTGTRRRPDADGPAVSRIPGASSAPWRRLCRR